MSASARIYQNPAMPRELWFNFGWYIQKMQRFPSYEQWMGDFISKNDYDKIVRGVQDQLKDSSIAETAEELCGKAVCCSAASLCLCCPFCSCLVCLQRTGIFSLKTKSTAFLASSGVELDMRIEFVEYKSGQVGPPWCDSASKNLTLVAPEALKHQHGGPPPGCSLVITLQEAIPWPPPVTSAPPMEAMAGALTDAVKGAVKWVPSGKTVTLNPYTCGASLNHPSGVQRVFLPPLKTGAV